MNKKLLGSLLLVVFVTLAVTPVFATPTAGQKVPITISFSNAVTTITDEKITGNAIHRVIEVTYDITIDIDGVPTYAGTAEAVRNAHLTPLEPPFGLVLRDDYVFNINCVDGTFVGQAVIRIKGYDASVPTYDRAKCHALLHGTGVFEGQTINAGHPWVTPGPIQWSGYLLDK